MFARILVLVVFLFCILYVTNLALWLQEFNKLTYLKLESVERTPPPCHDVITGEL